MATYPDLSGLHNLATITGTTVDTNPPMALSPSGVSSGASTLPTRTTQVTAQVLSDGQAPARVTQVVLEALMDGQFSPRVTQVVLEVLHTGLTTYNSYSQGHIW